MLKKLISNGDLFSIEKGYNSQKNRNNSRNQNILALIITVIISSFVIGIRQKGHLQNLELLAYDRLVFLSNLNSQSEKLLLVEITDTDIKNQERWPLSDATLAQLLKKLQQARPTVIGLDIYRDIPQPPGTSSLRQQLQPENVISIEYLGTEANRVAPPPGVSQEQIGFNDLVLDADSKLRRNLMYARLGDRKLYSFALRLSLAYLRNNPTIGMDRDFPLTADDNFLYIGEVAFPRLKANSGGYRLEPSEALGWQVLLKYRSPNVTPRISLTEVLEGRVDPGLIKDKVVIIGTTASSINDYFFTPYGGEQSDMPGAIAHAQMVDQIINHTLGESSLFWFFPEAVELIWIGIWSSVGFAIAIRRDNPLKILGLGVAGVVSLGVICWLSFLAGGWIPLVPAALSLGLTLGSLLFQRTFYNYFYDSLTRLPNRVLFIRRLQRLRKQIAGRKSSESIMVLCIDLDRFKTINDALGYQVGDELLITTAIRLRKSLDKEFILARVGGDEFAIATRVADETAGLQLIDSLQKKLNVPFKIKGLRTSTAVTIGIFFHDLTTDFDSENVLRSARTAMYKAKASGKLTHQVFGSNMYEQAFKRLQLEADLYEAIEREEFELYYQPIIDLKTEKIAGFESLIRWNSPTRGFISPGMFIPVAEETGAIIPLGEWVLKEACNQMVRWQQQFPATSSFFISVNLSGKQFAQPNLVAIVQNILDSSGLNSSCLKLEITESMVMENVNEAIAILDNLKQLGLNLSMDDFGTGFSSFSYLHRFSMDTLKVDRSFVSNMNQSRKNFEIVSTIILLAHKLGMDVVAEGIETDLEKIALKELDCEYGQGYLFAKPLPVPRVHELLENLCIN